MLFSLVTNKVLTPAVVIFHESNYSRSITQFSNLQQTFLQNIVHEIAHYEGKGDSFVKKCHFPAFFFGGLEFFFANRTNFVH